MLINDLLKHTSLDCEQSKLLLGLAPNIDEQWQAHPQWHPIDHLKQHTAKRPDIDNPRILIVLDLLKQLLIVLRLVLTKNVVQNFM